MPVTLDNQPLPDAANKSPEPAATQATVMPITIGWRAPAVQASAAADSRIDIGRFITPALASFLGLATLVAVVVGAVGWADVHPFPIIAVGMSAVFAALLARVQFGRGRRAPLVGALLLPVLALCATAAPYLDDGIGGRSYHPRSFSEVESDYRFGIGNLDIDLRDVAFPPGEHVITIEHGIGAAHVHLPTNVSSSATADIAIGRLDLLGQADDGFNTGIRTEANEGTAATIVIEFDTSIGYGSVERD